jgi:Outer membrane protein beta-barrel domain
MIHALTMCVLILALPRAAGAEWHFTPMIGETFLGRTSIVDLEAATDKHHKNLGGSVALLGKGVLGVEGLVVWTPGFFQTGDQGLLKKSRTLTLMGNVMVTAPRRWTEYTLRPFVSGGFGLLNVSKTEVHDVLPASANMSGYNIGGGAIGFLSKRTGVRFDVRYYNNIGSSETASFGPAKLRFMTASVGVVLRR